MASLSDLPEPERSRALRLSYLSYAALAIGALGAILWLRGALPPGLLWVAVLLLAAFVVFEVFFPLYVRRLLRRSGR